jgi:hypothetical protein
VQSQLFHSRTPCRCQPLRLPRCTLFAGHQRGVSGCSWRTRLLLPPRGVHALWGFAWCTGAMLESGALFSFWPQADTATAAVLLGTACCAAASSVSKLAGGPAAAAAVVNALLVPLPAPWLPGHGCRSYSGKTRFATIYRTVMLELRTSQDEAAGIGGNERPSEGPGSLA